mmetsp:Transcript_28970/g.58786  ORF Transcript_28970/g.58786 Transcript_28970/m.58786 type:complete len:120 (-) Transcript_28970:52-411(-)
MPREEELRGLLQTGQAEAALNLELTQRSHNPFPQQKSMPHTVRFSGPVGNSSRQRAHRPGSSLVEMMPRREGCDERLLPRLAILENRFICIVLLSGYLPLAERRTTIVRRRIAKSYGTR